MVLNSIPNNCSLQIDPSWVMKGGFDDFNFALKERMLHIRWSILMDHIGVKPHEIVNLASFKEFSRYQEEMRQAEI